MQRFTRLYAELDATTRTSEKLDALRRYFAEAPPRDAAWALYFLTGRKLKRAVQGRALREWTADASTLPLWLLEECYDAVGDLAETIALVLPDHATTSDAPLHRVVEERIVPLPGANDATRKELLQRTWRELDAQQRFVFNKLITGSFRVGVAGTLVARALAAVAQVPAATMAHRLTGQWRPTENDYLQLLSGDGVLDPGRPYPFYLAHPLENEPDALGDIAEWQVEWKWDGIRAQIIRRGGETLIWSRGEELVTERFPEIAAPCKWLPDGTVLDGEILAWKESAPLPFAVLQQRIGRSKLGPRILAEAPVVFLAFDLLENGGVDARTLPLFERRAVLEHVVANASDIALRISPLVRASSWEELGTLRREARARSVEGMMLKRRDSEYGVGRKRGDWWKWKIEPFAIDAVLMYAQRGSGRRASLYTDYTFGVWHEGALVPVAKAYSGLTDEEIRRVDRFVRNNTIEKFGPVRSVTPSLVFEIAFEGIQASTRHRSGVAVRFPRMSRWREDKKAEEADTLTALHEMMSHVASAQNAEART